MDPVSMSQSSSYSSQVITKAQQTQGVVLLQLLDAIRNAEVAQAKPLANLLDTSKFDVYA
jgi:hypothetical protein